MRIKWYMAISVILATILLLTVLILAIVKPMNGVYWDPNVNCACGHSYKYIVYNGIVIEAVEGHDSYRLYGHYQRLLGSNVGRLYRNDGIVLPHKFEMVPEALSMQMKASYGNSRMWRIPSLDIEGYLKGKTYQMQGPIDPVTKRAVQLKLTYAEIVEWSNRASK